MSAAILPFRARSAPPIQTEAIAALLMAMEDAPWSAPLAYALRDGGGRPFVAVIQSDRTWRLSVDDARTAAAALIAEQAFVGCMANADVLTFAADAADRAFQRPIASHDGDAA